MTDAQVARATHDELVALRERVATLEKEVATLPRRLRIADLTWNLDGIRPLARIGAVLPPVPMLVIGLVPGIVGAGGNVGSWDSVELNYLLSWTEVWPKGNLVVMFSGLIGPGLLGWLLITCAWDRISRWAMWTVTGSALALALLAALLPRQFDEVTVPAISATMLVAAALWCAVLALVRGRREQE